MPDSRLERTDAAPKLLDPRPYFADLPDPRRETQRDNSTNSMIF